jgi:isocitrate lyase
MTLAHLFLLYRYKTGLVHYLSPTDDNQHQSQKMKRLGLFSKVDTEGQMIIVATVNHDRVAELLNPDHVMLKRLIMKQDS